MHHMSQNTHPRGSRFCNGMPRVYMCLFRLTPHTNTCLAAQLYPEVHLLTDLSCSSLADEVPLVAWAAWVVWAPWGVDTMTLAEVASAACLAQAWAASAAVDLWEVNGDVV